MNINIIDIYYNKKTEDILEYAIEILNDTKLKQKSTLSDLKNIIHSYIIDDMKDRIKISYISEKFMNSYNIFHYKLKNITNYIINYSKKINKEELEKKSEYILMLSSVMLFATELDIKSNIFLNDKIKYQEVVNKTLKENRKILKKEVVNIIKEKSSILTSKIKKNVSRQRIFFKKLEDNNFLVICRHINKDKNTDIYDMELTIKNKRLSKYNQKIVQEQLNICKNHLNILYTKIFNIHKLVIKMQYMKSKDVRFILDIPNECIPNVTTFSKVLKLLNDEKIYSHVIIKVPYENYEKNFETYKLNKLIPVAVYNIKKIKKSILKTVDYMILDKFDEKREDEILFAKENKIKIIDDKFLIQSNEELNESDLLKYISNK